MGETSDDEHIWTDLVTPERAAKGDLDLTRHAATGYIRHARAEERTVARYLADRELIQHYEHWYGERLTECRKAFLAPVACNLGAAAPGGADGTGFAATLYVRITRRLPPAVTRTILYAMAEQGADITPATLRAPVAVYRDAFERLVHVTDEESKALREALKKSVAPDGGA